MKSARLYKLKAADSILKRRGQMAFASHDAAVKAGDDETVRVARERFLAVSIALRQSANAIARVAAREGRP